MQARFVVAFTGDPSTSGNATQSALAAGYSPTTARVQAQNLLALEHVAFAIRVREAIQVRQAARLLARVCGDPGHDARIQVLAARAALGLAGL